MFPPFARVMCNGKMLIVCLVIQLAINHEMGFTASVHSLVTALNGVKSSKARMDSSTYHSSICLTETGAEHDFTGSITAHHPSATRRNK